MVFVATGAKIFWVGAEVAYFLATLCTTVVMILTFVLFLVFRREVNHYGANVVHAELGSMIWFPMVAFILLIIGQILAGVGCCTAAHKKRQLRKQGGLTHDAEKEAYNAAQVTASRDTAATNAPLNASYATSEPGKGLKSSHGIIADSPVSSATGPATGAYGSQMNNSHSNSIPEDRSTGYDEERDTVPTGTYAPPPAAPPAAAVVPGYSSATGGTGADSTSGVNHSSTGSGYPADKSTYTKVTSVSSSVPATGYNANNVHYHHFSDNSTPAHYVGEGPPGAYVTPDRHIVPADRL